MAELGLESGPAELGGAVIGFRPRSTHADYFVLPAGEIASKPAAVAWAVAPSLAGVAVAAWAALEAVSAVPGETIVISGAAGRVGNIACQLARRRGVHLIGIASERDFEFLRSLRRDPDRLGPGLKEWIQSLPRRVDGYLDNVGDGKVELALAVGVPRKQINTIADPVAAQQYRVKAAGQRAGVLLHTGRAPGTSRGHRRTEYSNCCRVFARAGPKCLRGVRNAAPARQHRARHA